MDRRRWIRQTLHREPVSKLPAQRQVDNTHQEPPLLEHGFLDLAPRPQWLQTQVRRQASRYDNPSRHVDSTPDMQRRQTSAAGAPNLKVGLYEGIFTFEATTIPRKQ